MVNTETIRKSQNSYSGGEIGAKVLGRVDLSKFNTGLRYAKNVFVEIEGAVSNRAGFAHGGRCKVDTGVVRFVSFDAPGDVSYVMELTAGKIRFIYKNALVLTDMGGIVEVNTPYAEEDLYDLNFSQSNDICTITHEDYEPQELRRTAFNVFSLVDIVVNPNITAPTISIPTGTGSNAGETEQAYKVAAVDVNGVESLPSAQITNENNLDVAGDKLVIEWQEVVGADAYVVYKRRAGNFGFMGFVRQEDVFSAGPPRVYRVTDQNINPNTGQTPKRADNPFPTVNDYPALSFLYQQRRCFAGSRNGPNTIAASQVGTFDGFRRSIPALPDDYFTLALGAARTQQIKHVVSLDDLMIFTASSEWRLSASNGFAATQPPDLRPQSNIGIGSIPPLVVGTDIMYIQTAGRTVYRMNYSFDFNKFLSEDISVLSKHLFKNRRVVGWCYAQEPHFLVFLFFDDGTALNFAYNREQQVFAWTRAETDGFIDACCAVREDGQDRVYIAVRRLVNGSYQRFFERQAMRDFSNVAEAFFVDCGVTQQSFVAISNVAGGVVYTATAHGLVDGQNIRLYDIVGEDLTNPDFDINTRYRVNVTASNQFTLEDYELGTAVNIDNFIYASGGKVRLMSNTITGLSHLNGRTVVALADGFVVPGLVVSGGSVTLPFQAGIRTAGLPYESEIHTLELEREEQPTRGRRKSVAYLVARILETRGIATGLRPEEVYEVKERDYEPYNDPVNPGSEIIRVPVAEGWEDELKLIIKQSQPLPMTILSVIPEYTVGE